MIFDKTLEDFKLMLDLSDGQGERPMNDLVCSFLDNCLDKAQEIHNSEHKSVIYIRFTNCEARNMWTADYDYYRIYRQKYDDTVSYTFSTNRSIMTSFLAIRWDRGEDIIGDVSYSRGMSPERLTNQIIDELLSDEPIFPAEDSLKEMRIWKQLSMHDFNKFSARVVKRRRPSNSKDVSTLKKAMKQTRINPNMVYEFGSFKNDLTLNNIHQVSTVFKDLLSEGRQSSLQNKKVYIKFDNESK